MDLLLYVVALQGFGPLCVVFGPSGLDLYREPESRSEYIPPRNGITAGLNIQPALTELILHLDWGWRPLRVVGRKV